MNNKLDIVMKFYETNFDEYIAAVHRYNIHPEYVPIFKHFSNNIQNFANLILYGPPGIGKYSQALYLLEKYSPSYLKYQKRMTVSTDKQQYIYHISDIHYEIDMSLLGCNSKFIWHEIFLQIVDIISVKSNKIGIILCKNFHQIHPELLDIFYSYIQQYNNINTSIHIKFVFITEHISFIPNNILNICQVLSFKRPAIEHYKQIYTDNTHKSTDIISEISPNELMNIKEIMSFATIESVTEIPNDIFNIICNKIIEEMTNRAISFSYFRDIIYDILVYNLEAIECFFFILSHFVQNGMLNRGDTIYIFPYF